MNKIAVVFPGQGSQFVGMGLAMFKEFSPAREVFVRASEAINVDLAGLCFSGPPEKLDLTEFTQPCVLTVSWAAYQVLQHEVGVRPAAAAGHSLGEYTALLAAGVLTLEDAVRAVHRRGQWMQEAVPVGEGGMAAVMGLPRELIAACCEEAGQGEVVLPVNDNSPDQVVISGQSAALDRAMALIKKRGGKVRRLKVSSPFHTPLMKTAAAKMAGFLADLHFFPFSFPVISNVDAEPYPGAEAVVNRLTEQIVRPVRWRETVERLADGGVHLFIECGPGVLSGLIRKTLPSPLCFSVDEPEDLPLIQRALSS